MEPLLIPHGVEQPAGVEPAPDQDRVSYLGFYLGAEVYGLPLDRLREVARVAKVRRLPGAPPGVAGLVNVRGEILCALNMRAILGLEQEPFTGPTFLIALRGFGYPIGLAVDAIADIFSLAPDEILPTPPAWPAERSACFVGTAQVPAGLMGLLDLDRIARR
jgi:purine-binding chemotaxis protein CheW